MSNYDIVNNIKITHLSQLVMNIDQTLFTNALDTANYDGGYFLSPFIASTSGGTFTFTLQEADLVGGPYTDVPTDKLIDPGGLGNIVLSGIAVLIFFEKLGSFSTKRFIRFEAVSAGTVGGNVIEVIATRSAELKPALNDII